MNIGCDLDGVIIDHRNNQARLLKRRGVFSSRKKYHASKKDMLHSVARIALDILEKKVIAASS